MTFKVTISKFSDDDSADITVDGRNVGWLERVKSERFASVTSRARVSFVSHYSIMLTDDAADAQLKKHDVDSRKEAKLEISRAFEQAWAQLCLKGAAAKTACTHENSHAVDPDGAGETWRFCNTCGANFRRPLPKE